ncbi:Uncharacterized protein Rs2_10690 [Raphanus sativus]|nr:Uncharacterized protein Rs2_10690 [Raphanus sativus]
MAIDVVRFFFSRVPAPGKLTKIGARDYGGELSDEHGGGGRATMAKRTDEDGVKLHDGCGLEITTSLVAVGELAVEAWKVREDKKVVCGLRSHGSDRHSQRRRPDVAATTSRFKASLTQRRRDIAESGA